MSSIDPSKETSSVSDQLAGVVVEQFNHERVADEILKTASQDSFLAKALAEMAKARDFIQTPDRILGSEGTKHGEIAEQIEVALRRARDVLEGVTPTASFDGIGRTAAVDYRIDGIDVQSKFINGANNTLNHVLDHMEKCKEFGRDGSYYHTPKDIHAQILRVLNGDTDGLGLSDRTIRAIHEKALIIETGSGRPFEEVVRPSVSDYPEVQLGRVESTLDKHDQGLQQRNEALKNQIHVDHQPSLTEGVKASGTAAVVGAAVGFTTAVLKKRREGKNVFKGEFTKQDWKDIGVSSAKGGAGGAIAGGAIYALTNVAEFSAPFAAAFVSAAKGLAPLVADYNAGNLSLEAFIDKGLFVCSDVAIVGLCTAAGQALIPIPVLGAALGSIAGKFLSALVGNQVQGVVGRLNDQLSSARTALGAEFQKQLDFIEAEFERIGNLTREAFELSRNERLVETSLALARAHGVDEFLLLKDQAELDGFMTR